jgi:carbonic anhydrase
MIRGVLPNIEGKYPELNYPNKPGELKNAGDSLKFTPAEVGQKGTFRRPDGMYSLLQYHIHYPSEHRVDGVDFPAEIHCKAPSFNEITI